MKNVDRSMLSIKCCIKSWNRYRKKLLPELKFVAKILEFGRFISGTGTIWVHGTGIGNFHFLWWYGNRYRKNSVPENILGTGIGKIWYRNRYRKNFVPKKVPVSVSKIFGTRKKYQYCLKFRVPSHTVGVVAVVPLV